MLKSLFSDSEVPVFPLRAAVTILVDDTISPAPVLLLVLDGTSRQVVYLNV